MQRSAEIFLTLEPLRRVMFEFQPQIVFHLAAQSLVRRSYADPIGTFSTNVLGTANVLEARAFDAHCAGCRDRYHG